MDCSKLQFIKRGAFMSKLYIKGPCVVEGEIDIHGAKNSVLPILAATFLCNGTNIIHNCPDLSDVKASIKILSYLGCKCCRQGSTVIVDSTTADKYDIPHDLMREMRSSIIFLGAILARAGRAKLCSPGGCELGPRPIDMHIDGLKTLGAEINESHGYLNCNIKTGLSGNNVWLMFPSVGATENIMLAASVGKGTTFIHNAAKEPEICDLANFLNKAGADIKGAGTDTICINGKNSLSGAEHTVIPDRIAVATYLSAAAISGGSIKVNFARSSHMMSIISSFRHAGCKLKCSRDYIYLKSPKRLLSIPTVQTSVYPGFPTDAAPLLLAMQTVAKGTTIFVENIFESRFKYTDELKRLGADINVKGNVAVVRGVNKLSAAAVECTDLRGGAALTVAALRCDGITEIDKIAHIDRGYENLEQNFTKLGVQIKRY